MIKSPFASRRKEINRHPLSTMRSITLLIVVLLAFALFASQRASAAPSQVRPANDGDDLYEHGGYEGPEDDDEHDDEHDDDHDDVYEHGGSETHHPEGPEHTESYHVGCRNDVGLALRFSSRFRPG